MVCDKSDNVRTTYHRDDSMNVYAVYRNADMTEGRGPMILEKLFVSRMMAWTYANNQRGIMGRSPFRDHIDTRKIVAEKYKSLWNDPICKGWACTSCYPYGAEWQVRQLEVTE